MRTRDTTGHIVPTPRLTGRPWRTLVAQVLRLSDLCHICGHPGADSADHVIPLARGGTNHPSNLRPAHHTNPCPTCGQRCNRVKGDRPAANGIIRRSRSLNRPRD